MLKADKVNAEFVERANQILPKGWKLKTKVRNGYVIDVQIITPFTVADKLSLNPECYVSRIPYVFFANDQYEPNQFHFQSHINYDYPEMVELLEVYEKIYALTKELAPEVWSEQERAYVVYDCWFKIYVKPTLKASKNCGFNYATYQFNLNTQQIDLTLQ